MATTAVVRKWVAYSLITMMSKLGTVTHSSCRGAPTNAADWNINNNLKKKKKDKQGFLDGHGCSMRDEVVKLAPYIIVHLQKRTSKCADFPYAFNFF